MKITANSWSEYTKKLSQLNQKAGALMREYIGQHGTEDTKPLMDYAMALIQKYGEGSAELACQMYDSMAQMAGVNVPSAEPADVASYKEVAKMVNATKDSPAQMENGVSRLVKRAGADTTLKNAKRDKAEFAWIPHGDTCSFCITLASRGWQTASEDSLKGDHAEHIHANCDCEYAIRFSKDTDVEGYDPDEYLQQYKEADGDINAMRRMRYASNKDRINEQKREAYLQQEYRKVERGEPSTFTMLRRGTEQSITARQVSTYNTPVYISDQAQMKPKELHAINKNTENALKQWGVNLDSKPKIVVVGDDELFGALGLYDPCENVVYYAQSIARKEVQEAAGGEGVVEYHEMWHMKQAEDFRKAGWTITRENRGDYLSELCGKCKNHIDKLGIAENNVGEISDYAEKMYLRGRFDEVEAEYNAMKQRR